MIATYTTTTFHFIKKDWKLQSLIVDFKVFHGTTSGQAIYMDQVTVLEKFTTKSNVVIGISDTAGNMGVLEQYLRRNGMELDIVLIMLCILLLSRPLVVSIKLHLIINSLLFV